VKEFRQGLRTRGFVASFLVVQICAVSIVGLMLTMRASNPSQNSSDIGPLIWLVIFGVLVFAQPARARASLAEEIKSNTSELLIMSALSPARVVWGKWLSSMAQGLLLLTSVLPYFILRYYFGRIEVASEAVILAVGILVSCPITAAQLFSATVPKWVSVVLAVIGSPMLFGMLACMGQVAGDSNIGALIALVFLCGLFTLVGCEVAAGNLVAPGQMM
jgi:ABC-type Na+ efflux pump permease subunit